MNGILKKLGMSVGVCGLLIAWMAAPVPAFDDEAPPPAGALKAKGLERKGATYLLLDEQEVFRKFGYASVAYADLCLSEGLDKGLIQPSNLLTAIDLRIVQILEEMESLRVQIGLIGPGFLPPRRMNTV